MTTSRPIAFIRRIASGLSGFSTSATATRPNSFPSATAYIGVLPSSARRSATSPNPPRSTPSDSTMRRLPAWTTTSPILARMPWPGSASKSEASSSLAPFEDAPRTMAWPRGCSEPCSADATSRSSSSSSTPSAGSASVSSGLPSVTVPVLSSTTAPILWAVSSASPLLIRMPCSAPLPVATMMAVGVASPSAQGQAMTSTEMKIRSAKAMSRVAMYQATAATSAIAHTAGTK